LKNKKGDLNWTFISTFIPFSHLYFKLPLNLPNWKVQEVSLVDGNGDGDLSSHSHCSLYAIVVISTLANKSIVIDVHQIVNAPIM